MPSTKGLTSLSKQHKQDCPQIPTQVPTCPPTTTTTKKAPATTPSTKSDTVKLHIYQPPSSLRGWADNQDLEAPLRHLGLLDVARLQLPTGAPEPCLVSELIASYDPKKRRSYVFGSRVNVDRESFLRAVSLHPTAERKDLPRNVPWSTVTRAAEQFINMCLRVQWRDTLPTVSAAMREVKAGSAHTVEWGKLMWDVVEHEILELPKRDDKVSYFGVYLQRLIWVQQPELFKICEKVDAAVKKANVKAKVKAAVKAALVKFSSEIAIWVGMEQPQLVNNPSNLVESDGEAAEVVQVQQQPMEVQKSQLAIVLNDDVGVGKSDRKRLSSTPNDGNMHTGGHNDHTEAHQRFQQGNQQKRGRNDKTCGVPTGSAIATANNSHDIVEIERELKHATSDELGEAETFIQVVKLVQEKLPAETIMHMFE